MGTAYRPKEDLNIMITKIGNMATKLTFYRVGLRKQLKQVTRGTANSS